MPTTKRFSLKTAGEQPGNRQAWLVIVTLLLVIGMLLCSKAALGEEAGQQLLLMRGGWLVDPRTETTQRASILVRGTQIERIIPANEVSDLPSLEAKARAGEGNEPTPIEVLDLEGRFVLPTLHDLHVHAYGNPGPDGLPELLGLRVTANRMLYAGVAAFLDLSNYEQQTLDFRDRQRAERPMAAELYSAGAAFTCPGGHGTQFPNPAREVSNPAEARAAVAEVAKRSPDVVKLIYNPSYKRLPSMDRPTMEAIVQAAKEHGLPTVAHVDYWQDAEHAIEAGVDAITHTPAGKPPQALLDLMRLRGTAHIPTLAVHCELPAFQKTGELPESELLRALAHPELRQAYADLQRWTDAMRRRSRLQADSCEQRLQAMAEVARAGVTVLTGTDAGNPGVFQGYSVHREMALLVQSGLSPWQALRAATVDAADFLGRPAGFAAGDQASFVVLAASPIENIVHTERIVAMVHRGKVLDRAALDLEPSLFSEPASGGER